jgi:hypothetical protein
MVEKYEKIEPLGFKFKIIFSFKFTSNARAEHTKLRDREAYPKGSEARSPAFGARHVCPRGPLTHNTSLHIPPCIKLQKES